jgi:hypothetical protein
MCYIYIAWTELRGVPTEFVVKLIPQHAKKQCAFLGIWWESSSLFFRKEKEREKGSSSWEVTWIFITSTFCWTKRRHVQQLSVAEMCMLRWCCGHTRSDRVRNDDIRDRVGVPQIKEKLIQHRLRWFEHVQRRPPEAPVRSGVLKRADNVKSGRGRPKLTWNESVKINLKEWNISKDLAMDRSA